MIRKLLNRIIQGVIVLFVLFTLTFFLCRALPGGPYQSEKAIPEHVKKKMLEQIGYDKPLLEQYLLRFKGQVQGDTGLSIRLSGRPVNDIIAQSFPVSFQLGVVSMILALLIGVPAGVISAWKKIARSISW